MVIPRARAALLTLVAALGLTIAAVPPASAADGTIRGTVTEAGSGTPLGGVAVQAFCWQVSGSTQGALCGETQTAGDGTYALSVAAGTYKVFFDAFPNHRSQFYGGGATLSSADSLQVVVPSGGSVNGINAALVPLRNVSGTVTGNGASLAGINVTAYRESAGVWQPVQSSLTGPDGTYALHLAAGRYRVGFVDPTGPYQAEFYDDAAGVAGATDVDVGTADVGGIDADLALNYPITGAVTVDGIDMPGVTVTAWRQVPGGPGSTAWEAVKFTSTGPDGRYTLYLPDGTYRVEFRTFQGGFPTLYYDGAGSLDDADDVIVAGAEVPNIDASIFREDPESGPAITGTVTVAGSGEPADGVSVTAYRFNVLASAWQPVRFASTAPDGTYAVRVPEGPYRVGFSHFETRYQPVYYDGSDTLDGAAEIVVPSEGVPNIDAQVVENHTITGLITADPVPGLPPEPPPTLVTALRWNPDSSEWEPVSTGFNDPSGSYRVYVPDGTYRLRFMPFFELFEPLYYDGVDSIGEATDVPVAGADVQSIDIHLVAGSTDPPPPWPRASTLSAPGQDAWGPAVAVAPDGGATAVWYRRDGSNARVQAASRGPAGSWTSPVNLSPAGADAIDPQVSAWRNGTAVAVWRGWDGARYQVQAATRSAGGWSSPVVLSGPGGDAWDPQVTMGEKGTAVAVWRQSAGSGSRVHAADLKSNGRWSPPAALSQAGDSWDARVAMGSDGSAVAAWSRLTGAHYRVEVASRAANGRWSTAVALSPPGADAVDPQVAAEKDGAAAAVWRQWDDGSERILAATRTTGGAWSSSEAVSPEGQNAHEPDVALHPDGTVSTVWARWDGGNERVQAASRAPGGQWSSPTKLSRAGEDARWPRLVAGADGSETAVWLQSNGFSESAMAAIRMPAATWSTPARISEPAQRASGPAVAAGADGTVAAVWERRAGVDRVQGVVRVDPPGAHCSNQFGVDLNLLFGVPEPLVDPPCTTVPERSSWRPLTIWITSTEFEAAPPGFVPAAGSPVEDLAAKLETVRVVIDGGTKRERTQVFSPDEALRIDRVFSEYWPGAPDLPMGVSIPKVRELRAGDHTVEVIWRLSDQHCDGFTEVAEVSCLPSGNTSFGTRRFTVVSQ